MLSTLCNQIQSWWRQVPLPSGNTGSSGPVFQEWFHYHNSHWTPTAMDDSHSASGRRWSVPLRIVSWNVDAGSKMLELRMSALLRTIKLTAIPDIIFLQEVSRNALIALLSDPWVQEHWYLSDVNDSGFGKQKFINLTLVSKSWFLLHPIKIGPVWRIALPTHLGRDALCCDIVINYNCPHPSHMRRHMSTRLRLINVHLDSLPINPSYRPQQVAVAASYLRSADCGLVAGDFNSILPEDEAIISDNSLIDAWVELHPNSPGFTWGVDGDGPFPPKRLDRVALHNLTPSNIRLLPTHVITSDTGDSSSKDRRNTGEALPFSDHLGIYCVVNWNEPTYH